MYTFRQYRCSADNEQHIQQNLQCKKPDDAFCMEFTQTIAAEVEWVEARHRMKGILAHGLLPTGQGIEP